MKMYENENTVGISLPMLHLVLWINNLPTKLSLLSTSKGWESSDEGVITESICQT